MLLDTLMKRGKEFLGCDVPIMCGAMTWVSDCTLIGAVGNAGGFGLLAGGNTPADILVEEILKTRACTEMPFGVNLITLAPAYKEQLSAICDLDCKVVVFAGGLPKEPEIRQAQDAGSKVICFAPTAPLALRLIKMGADAIMLEGSEAGGHIGPVTLSVLIQQILFKVDSVPIFVAGGIATGRMMAHLLMMGAAGIQMGTRFVMSEECKAHPKFKEVFKRAKARDAIATPQFDSRLPVIPVRALKNEGMDKFSKLQFELIKDLEEKKIEPKEAQYRVENYWAGALREAAVDGDVSGGSLMAGQSVGIVTKIQPVKEIINEMMDDAEIELKRLRNILN